jgi:RHS repeat-associated protein
MFVSKGDGAIVGRASYRGFGTHTVTGQLGERSFAGGFEISGLGLVVLGPRVLDSDTGRFLSQDPVFNAVNLYAYAQGNPVFFWDPTGYESRVYAVAGNVGAVGGVAIALGVTVFGTAPSAGAAWLAFPFVAAPLATAGSGFTVHTAHLVWHAIDPTAPEPTAGELLFGGWVSLEGLGRGVQGGRGSPVPPPPPPPPAPPMDAYPDLSNVVLYFGEMNFWISLVFTTSGGL